jgi:hypothetical protein
MSESHGPPPAYAEDSKDINLDRLFLIVRVAAREIIMLKNKCARLEHELDILKSRLTGTITDPGDAPVVRISCGAPRTEKNI